MGSKIPTHRDIRRTIPTLSDIGRLTHIYSKIGRMIIYTHQEILRIIHTFRNRVVNTPTLRKREDDTHAQN